ncbi:MAG: hypothetical protein HFH14_02100 [Lachnospiraceae bacterium]|nr:hypothetical protein [Lachnospiraceae bacterium]
MSNLYSEDFRIGEIKNTSRYASVSYNTSKKSNQEVLEIKNEPDDNAHILEDVELSGTKDDYDKACFDMPSDKIITFNMKMLLCAQIVLCIIFTFMALEFSKKPENYYNAKKIYGVLQNSSGIHKLEETLIAAKNDILKEK